MSQSKQRSLQEACLNVAIGFIISLIANILILPLYGVHVPVSTDIAITAWFTVISLARTYVLRRVMNKGD